MKKEQADPGNICFGPEKSNLTPLQKAVTKGATEEPFNNEYWDNYKPGLYVDVINGVPLFASTEKYDSGSGWPSFWQPIDIGRLELIEDRSHGMVRTEVRSRSSGAHLGHVFNDGPDPTGLRYCMNSAALRFIPASDLEKEGLSEYAGLFKSET
ncbi:peptide-methionine (R)-S-oxide reductase MsrB [Breznakiella homolactica]|uniref:peptide-methionine (R)-S-oxide reductase n=1 Tax=Breznakiella homolactica TaxID=2798577 RepID=A0A7T7XPT6_9SPIR|nr:peptide-methionine (R)-S-oxide reductase MsrB [Breznakiella homolactica]QQO10239.1 peptide-methionine (R)-S-oxide reductase MsrB [Breznakiella homolactica]